jgi:hypothetical protein
MKTKNILSPKVGFSLSNVYCPFKDSGFYNEAIKILKSKKI